MMRYVTGYVTEPVEKSCEYCGVHFAPKRRTAKFCSGACRQAAHVGRPAKDATRKCLVCGRAIGHRRADAIYCDDQCRSIGGRMVREAVGAIRSNELERPEGWVTIPHWEFFNAYADAIEKE